MDHILIKNREFIFVFLFLQIFNKNEIFFLKIQLENQIGLSFDVLILVSTNIRIIHCFFNLYFLSINEFKKKNNNIYRIGFQFNFIIKKLFDIYIYLYKYI